MNYRHAFHAGNFADVFKHLLLSRILVYLARKPAAFRVIDTHAGLGRYDLAGPEAMRTGEWRDGIGRIDRAAVPLTLAELVAPYFDAVGPRSGDHRPLSYPGSPALALHLLRPHDRLLLAERHPEDAGALRHEVGRDRRVKLVEGDGYMMLNAALPPPERRGLVLIDPPFEDRTEFDAIAAALRTAVRKWATGTYAVWYPIKDPAAVAVFMKTVSALPCPDQLSLTLTRQGPASSTALRGCGLLVINPPFVLADEARNLLPWLSEALSGPGEPPFRPSIQSTTAVSTG